jgi:hypothetical protein
MGAAVRSPVARKKTETRGKTGVFIAMLLEKHPVVRTVD